MKAIITTAKDYQTGFKSGLVFCGFDDDQILWLGTNKQFQEKERLEFNY